MEYKNASCNLQLFFTFGCFYAAMKLLILCAIEFLISLLWVKFGFPAFGLMIFLGLQLPFIYSFKNQLLPNFKRKPQQLLLFPLLIYFLAIVLYSLNWDPNLKILEIIIGFYLITLISLAVRVFLKKEEDPTKKEANRLLEYFYLLFNFIWLIALVIKFNQEATSNFFG